jgi:hypothetical protein
MHSQIETDLHIYTRWMFPLKKIEDEELHYNNTEYLNI